MVSENTLNIAKNNFQSRFKNFWNNFVGEVDKAEQNYAQEIFDFGTDTESGVISVQTLPEEVIRFEQVPYRVDDSSEVLDVCVQFKERVKPIEGNTDCLEIQESKVSVNYLNTTTGQRSGEVELETGLRFEFDSDPQDHHPVFHVHYDRRCINSEVLTGRYGINPNDDDIPNRGYPRIPSAPMDVLSVIQLIMHDHIPSEISNDGWPSSLSNLLEDFPTFPSHSFEPSPQGGNPMVSDWWYMHQSIDSKDNTHREIPSSRIPD
jgi:hypothetical protein